MALLVSPGTSLLAAPIDISSAFNTDLIATVEGAEEGWGFGSGGNQMLASDSFAKSIDPNFVGVPDNGIVSDGTHTFTLGPLDGPNSVTKVLPGEANYELFGGAPATIDIANGSYSDLTVLFFWGSWGASGQEGAFTVNYTTGDPDTFAWLVADGANPANTNDGATPLVLGPMNRYRRNGEFNGTYSFFKQTFDVDPSREIESLVFGAGAAQDNSGDNGYFNIFALDGTPVSAPVPEPASAALALLGLTTLGVCVRRRRK